MLLSRVAENLYWAGRYLERAEDTARIVREHTNLLIDLPLRAPVTWEPLLAVVGERSDFDERYQRADEASILKYLIGDPDHPGSVLNSIGQTRENLRTTREVLPREAWTAVNDLYLYMVSNHTDGVARRSRSRFLERVIGESQRVVGILTGTMRRDEAWDFWRLGMQVERADMATRVLDVLAGSVLDAPDRGAFADVRWMSVLRSLSALQMYHRAMPRAGLRAGRPALPAVRRPLPPGPDGQPRRGGGRAVPAAPTRRGAALLRRGEGAPGRGRRRHPGRRPSPPAGRRPAGGDRRRARPPRRGLLPARPGELGLLTQMADAPTLPTYRTDGVRFDELADEQGRPREHWRRLVQVFDRLGAAELDDRRRLADRLLSSEGASYVVHDDGRDESRPWQIDPVPLLWPERDWAALERGLAQRTRLLEALLADLYGPQRLLREGVVPAEVVFASSGFRWPCVGWSPAGGTPAHRGRGRRRPGGLGPPRGAARPHRCARGAGYALVNRKVLSRLFPDVYRELRVERLSGWFDDLRAALARLAPPDRPSPRTVVLTPGIGHPSYFEHTYLASHLGYHLVEGPDLAVRGGRAWLRALAGLEPVDVVLRRVEDGHADPLELGDPGPGGVPGLVQASREGGLGVANALGSGLAGDVALQAYLPAACEALLDERLLLASPRTLWLGDAGQRAEALSDLADHGAPRARPERRHLGVRGPAGGVRTAPTCSGPSNGTRAATWPRPASSWAPRR